MSLNAAHRALGTRLHEVCAWGRLRSSNQLFALVLDAVADVYGCVAMSGHLVIRVDGPTICIDERGADVVPMVAREGTVTALRNLADWCRRPRRRLPWDELNIAPDGIHFRLRAVVHTVEIQGYLD